MSGGTGRNDVAPPPQPSPAARERGRNTPSPAQLGRVGEGVPPAMKRLRRLLGTELPIALILAFALLPWIWMMLSSIRPDSELTHSPIALLPQQLTLIHHIELLKRTNFAQNLRDSLIVACGAV